MAFPNFIDIWRRLPLSHVDLVDQIVAATSLAHSPHTSPLDCPWNHCTDRYSRACRVAWRVAFRIERERCRAQLAAEMRKAA